MKSNIFKSYKDEILKLMLILNSDSSYHPLVGKEYIMEKLKAAYSRNPIILHHNLDLQYQELIKFEKDMRENHINNL